MEPLPRASKWIPAFAGMTAWVGADVTASAEESTMALEMRSECERCKAALAADGEAHICSYECTFCPDCTVEMNAVCPNCGGELVPRPRRHPR